MIVAVPGVGAMEMSLHQIIRVIAVRHRRVPAARSVHVARVMVAAPVIGCAAAGVRRRHRNPALVDMIPVHRVEMAVVQVVRVAAMLDGLVPAFSARADARDRYASCVC